MEHLSRFTLYETRRCFWIIGHTPSNAQYRLLQLVPDPDFHNLRFKVSELHDRFDATQIEAWFDQQRQLAREDDDEFVQKAPPAWGLLGLIRFTACYYLCMVTKCSVVALLGGNQIFHIEETKLVPLVHSSRYLVPDRRSTEARLASTFHSLDLAKTFYFSPTYDLTNTLQTNMQRFKSSQNESRLNHMRGYTPDHSTDEVLEHIGGDLPANGGGTSHFENIDEVDDTKRYYKADENAKNATLSSDLRSSESATTPFPEMSGQFDDQLHLDESMAKMTRTHMEAKELSETMFVWNSYLLSPLKDGEAASTTLQVRKAWFLEIVHGFIDQARISVFGNNVYITLIARRSHQFAGARFFKRGVNKQGYPANEVETEQIVSNQLESSFSDRYTSYVQHRGSICVSWSQMSNNMSPQPPIRIDAVDPYYEAAAKHFNRMFSRYSYPICVLNLVKTREKRPRESVLSHEFEACIRYLNQFLPQDRTEITSDISTRRRGFDPVSPRLQTGHTKSSGRGLSLNGGVIEYTHWDMSRAAKSRSSVVMDYLGTYSSELLDKTSFFHAGKRIQSGVCRTNCIDCLDRTNAAQSVIAKYALGHQLHALGIIDRPKVDYDTDVMDLLTEMYHDHGDTLALQYGGSNLVNTVETYRRINQWSSHSRDLIESIRRFYSNSFMDAQRQDAINVFLGNYQYTEGTNLWDLSTDYYLHNSAMKNQIKYSYRQWYEPKNLLPPQPGKVNGDDVTKWRGSLRKMRGSLSGIDIDTTSRGFNTVRNAKHGGYTSLAQLFLAKINSTDRYSKHLSPFEVNDGKLGKRRRKEFAAQETVKDDEYREFARPEKRADEMESYYTNYANGDSLYLEIIEPDTGKTDESTVLVTEELRSYDEYFDANEQAYFNEPLPDWLDSEGIYKDYLESFN